tara:strand:+ start:283 stop:456 length:174 start_codon:yes stop_codon:yes gene_type:complete
VKIAMGKNGQCAENVVNLIATIVDADVMPNGPKKLSEIIGGLVLIEFSRKGTPLNHQ